MIDINIVSALKTYLQTCPLLENELSVDELGAKSGSASISPLAGATVVGRDILGNIKREYPFSFMSKEYTIDDLNRIDNSGFYQDLVLWFEAQTKARNFPNLGTGITVTNIEATSWGFLFATEKNAQLGVYQINCKLYYTQEG